MPFGGRLPIVYHDGPRERMRGEGGEGKRRDGKVCTDGPASLRTALLQVSLHPSAVLGARVIMAASPPLPHPPPHSPLSLKVCSLCLS